MLEVYSNFRRPYPLRREGPRRIPPPRNGPLTTATPLNLFVPGSASSVEGRCFPSQCWSCIASNGTWWIQAPCGSRILRVFLTSWALSDTLVGHLVLLEMSPPWTIPRTTALALSKSITLTRLAVVSEQSLMGLTMKCSVSRKCRGWMGSGRQAQTCYH